MNDEARSEFEQLKRKQSQLEQELATLAARLKRFESDLTRREELRTSIPQNEPVHSTAVPPPIPPTISPVPVRPSQTALTPAPVPAPPIATRTPAPPSFSDTSRSGTPPLTEAVPPEKRSFEMRLGTYWLVRIGIVMLLTGLVFFGNYAYQNYIGKLGAAGKISLLYLASGLLLCLGTWWQRKAAKESLKNYAEVLFAGGLAAVYFTTYAAHHIPNLRIISSALLDGALLLFWAAFMVWIADRKRSEVLALFAVGLAYYTSVITRVGSFTLYSNLILTAAAVFFLVRNRWAMLSIASVLATYASYAFWRFFDGSGWHWASPEEGLWFGAGFLVSYWVLFTAAVFLSKHERIAGPGRAGFLTFNNGAFLVMFVLTMRLVDTGGFWKFALIYGAVLLALTELARRVFPSEPIVKNSYLTQGLLLVTVGIISKFAGLQLALLLGAESVVLLTLGLARRNPILQGAAYLSGALAVGWGIDGLKRDDWKSLMLEAVLGGMMAFNAFWAHRQQPESKSLVRPVPGFFTLLALISWLFATAYNTSLANVPVVLALEALVLTLSIYVLRVREMTVFGQTFLLVAQAAWIVRALAIVPAVPWWNPALLIAITLGLSHWWQRQTIIPVRQGLSRFWMGAYSLAVVGVLYGWLQPRFSAPTWLALTAALAVAITLYGVLTRAWLLAVSGQLFLVFSIGEFVNQFVHTKPEWFFPFAPMLALTVLSLGTVKWFQRGAGGSESVREPLLRFALVYRWVACLMLLWWVQEYIPARERIWVFMLLGLIAFLWGGWRSNAEALVISGLFTVTGVALFWWPFHDVPKAYWPNLMALIALLAQQRLAKRMPQRFNLDARIHGAMITIGGLSLWLLLSRWVLQSASGFYLTASWSVFALALFLSGIILRERVYRWIGLAVLASALGRVVIFDVWKLETIYRILSFMALGIVLLVLGFIYNKYQEKIREWL
jgi:uncharacterized membrane protein